MKHVLTILAIACLTACAKKTIPPPAATSQPAPCSQPTGIKNISWHHVTGALATLKFRSDGKYFQNSDSSGTWSFHGCDSVYVQRPSNNFYYRVLSVTNDSLKLQNPAFGEVRYYK
jgi:hypothetical protein